MEQTEKYEFTAEMDEISGCGGEYEQLCRRMLKAALIWFDEHPNADPQFTRFRNVAGLITEENDDARLLSKAILDAADGDCTGAMHQAVVTTALWINKNGWDKYVQAMSCRVVASE